MKMCNPNTIFNKVIKNGITMGDFKRLLSVGTCSLHNESVAHVNTQAVASVMINIIPKKNILDKEINLIWGLSRSSISSMVNIFFIPHPKSEERGFWMGDGGKWKLSRGILSADETVC
jgi:hypothetical protein